MKGGSVIGHGIDVVDVLDFKRSCALLPLSSDPRFRQEELSDIEQGPNFFSTLAGRFAAKEAVLKALGKGWGDGISFTDIVITSLSTGQPVAELHNGAKRVAQDYEVDRWSISITHTPSLAIASAVALSSLDLSN